MPSLGHFWPELHASQSLALLPAEFENVPATHLVHEVELDAAHEPAGQAIGSSINVGQYFDDGQIRHDVDPI